MPRSATLPTLVGLVCLCLLPVAGFAADGAWRLSIGGHHTYYFGEAVLGGGIRIPWRITIDFRIRDGRYAQGHGKAEWVDELGFTSTPEGWFDCGLVEGTFLDRNLKLHETPWVRYPAFPVAGEVDEGQLTLVPAYRPPGNYLAVTFQCETRNPIATNWFIFAQRARNELGKRQDFELTEEHPLRRARIRQVKTIGPVGAMTLPLRDDWWFEDGAGQDPARISYVLRRVGD